jgi:hypothetical protein
MDVTLLLGLVAALIVVVGALGVISTRRTASGADSGLATSTEGMKVCPNCGMGNLWTERRCSACGNPLKG